MSFSLDSPLSCHSGEGAERIVFPPLAPTPSSEDRRVSLTPSSLTVSSFSPPICPVCRMWGPRHRSTSMPHLRGRQGQSVAPEFSGFSLPPSHGPWLTGRGSEEELFHRESSGREKSIPDPISFSGATDPTVFPLSPFWPSSLRPYLARFPSILTTLTHTLLLLDQSLSPQSGEA